MAFSSLTEGEQLAVARISDCLDDVELYVPVRIDRLLFTKTEELANSEKADSTKPKHRRTAKLLSEDGGAFLYRSSNAFNKARGIALGRMWSSLNEVNALITIGFSKFER